MNTKISKIGFSSIVFFITEPLFLHVGFTKIINSAETGTIYSIILGIILSFIILLFSTKLYNYEKDLTLFKKIDKIYGKKIGIFINSIITIMFTLYFIYLLWGINTYIQNKYLDATPSFIIILLFIIPVIWCVTCNMKTIAKVSMSVFFVNIFIIIFSILNLSSSIEIDNFKPFFNTPITKILKNALTFTAFFTTPMFMLLTTPKNKIDDSKDLSKKILFFYLISSINILLVFIFIIGVFGVDLAKLFSYPEYSLMKKINFFNFIQHIENITTIEWLYALFISNVIALNFIKEYLLYINLYKKKIFYGIIFLCYFFSLFIFKNTTIAYNIISNYYVYIYFIPIILLIFLSFFKIKKKN